MKSAIAGNNMSERQRAKRRGTPGFAPGTHSSQFDLQSKYNQMGHSKTFARRGYHSPVFGGSIDKKRNRLVKRSEAGVAQVS